VIDSFTTVGLFGADVDCPHHSEMIDHLVIANILRKSFEEFQH
jgi:hypothetical protein